MEIPAEAPEPITSEKLKVSSSVVLARDKDAGDGVEGPFAEAAVAEGVEAIVLVEEDGADATDQEVFARRVSKSVPVVLAVTLDALAKLGVGLTVHGEAGLDAGDEEGRIVEAVLAAR